jgi:hypothetical protein
MGQHANGHANRDETDGAMAAEDATAEEILPSIRAADI